MINFGRINVASEKRDQLLSRFWNWEEIIEGIEDKNLSAVVTFIDFKKAFDTIHRGKMIKILKAYGIPDIIVHAIEDTYQGIKAKVITSADGDTDSLAGVLQGYTLAPYLFIIVLDYCLRSAIEIRLHNKTKKKSQNWTCKHNWSWLSRWHCASIWHCCTSTRAAQ